MEFDIKLWHGTLKIFVALNKDDMELLGNLKDFIVLQFLSGTLYIKPRPYDQVPKQYWENYCSWCDSVMNNKERV